MVDPEAPSPWLRTLVSREKDAPGAGLLSLTVGESTTRSGEEEGDVVTTAVTS